MARRRNLVVVAGVLLAAGAIAFVAYWHWHAAPEAVRLLPESDTILYVDVRPIRLATGWGKNTSGPEDPDYKEFVQETGFRVERDLDQVAMGVVAPNWATQGPLPPPDVRSSEVLVGRFDAQKIAAYLKKLARAVENYRGIDIFSIPHQGRTVRVAIMTVNEVAVTNLDDPQAIRSMIDRARSAGSPFGGPELVQKHYHDVPFGSLAWGLAKIPDSVQGDSMPALPIEGGISLGAFPPGSVVVASLRYKGAIDLEATTITRNAATAQQIAEKLNAYLAIFRSLQAGAEGTDPDVKSLFDSLHVQQQDDHVTVGATVPPGFIQKALTPPPAMEAAPPAPEKSEAKPRKGAKRK